MGWPESMGGECIKCTGGVAMSMGGAEDFDRKGKKERKWYAWTWLCRLHLGFVKFSSLEG